MWLGKVEVAKTTETIPPKEGLDLDKLAKAVSIAETGGCTKGSAITHNNCFGIKRNNTCTVGMPRGSFVQFESQEQSFECFKTIWAKWYKKFPDRALAQKWTGGDRADIWLNIVKEYYL